MINLSLNFKSECKIPDNLEDFRKLLNISDFQYGFKVVGSNIIALTSYNKNNIENESISEDYNDLSELFSKLQYEDVRKSCYILKKRDQYTLNIDKELFDGKIDVETKTLNILLLAKNKITSLLFGEIIEDPYIDQIIKKYLEVKLGFTDRIEGILKIKNHKNALTVSYHRYIEKKGGNKDDLDYDKYGNVFVLSKIKIKKEDLI